MKDELVGSWRFQTFLRNKRLMSAFKKVPRELFLLPEYESEAYHDIPLPIPGGQTISQPTTVMMMLHALDLKSSDVVLEIGSGSGYNAAVMSHLAKKVYSLEIISELVEFAKKNLKKAKVKNVEVIKRDGAKGLKDKAPFNKIICTAACPKIPDVWIEQLADGGVLIAPVGDQYSQQMTKVTKVGNQLIKEHLGSFAFVPLKGELGF